MPRMIRACSRILLLASLVLFAAASAHAQDAPSPELFTLFAGAGALAKQGHALGELQAGASFDEAPIDAWYGLSLEGAYLGAWTTAKANSGSLSLDYMAAWNLDSPRENRTAKGNTYKTNHAQNFFPFVSAGYTRLFSVGNAVNFGGGLDYCLNHKNAIRIELRDYYSPASPSQHNIALRIGWVLYIPD
jgi:hypothetical protein